MSTGVAVKRICFRCGQEYQTMWRGKSKYCLECRATVRKERARFAVYSRNWQRQKKSRKYPCIFCQSVFDSAGELAQHRVDTGELSDLDFRKWVMAYRSTHSYWQTLDYFHISQETFKAIRNGKETTGHQ